MEDGGGFDAAGNDVVTVDISSLNLNINELLKIESLVYCTHSEYTR